MMGVPAALLSAIVTILAILFVFYTGINVAGMRSKHGVKAPAMSGHAEFDRAMRVQMNTLEQFVIFLPLLWLATSYFTLWGWLPPLAGLLWIVGRVIYMTSYMADPEKRGAGFGVTVLSSLVLLILAVWGIVNTWMAVSA